MAAIPYLNTWELYPILIHGSYNLSQYMGDMLYLHTWELYPILIRAEAKGGRQRATALHVLTLHYFYMHGLCILTICIIH